MHTAEERRMSARIEAPYPVRLRFVESDGHCLREEGYLRNLSGGGVYVALKCPLKIDGYVSLAIRLSTAPVKDGPTLRLAARGNVLRVEEQPDGTFGTAIEFKQRRVL
jgi:hypothetical protein